MTAKALKNPALREKFKVGDLVRLPRDVWTKLTSKMINLPRVVHVVEEVGDMKVQHGKNSLCRFGIVLGGGTSHLCKGEVIWEEWMLEKVQVVTPSTLPVETCSLVEDETTIPSEQFP